jgi:hypothetical protein
VAGDASSERSMTYWTQFSNEDSEGCNMLTSSCNAGLCVVRCRLPHTLRSALASLRHGFAGGDAVFRFMPVHAS